jgi:hypothetical protein
LINEKYLARSKIGMQQTETIEHPSFDAATTAFLQFNFPLCYSVVLQTPSKIGTNSCIICNSQFSRDDFITWWTTIKMVIYIPVGL